jgi:hypothetical protein
LQVRVAYSQTVYTRLDKADGDWAHSSSDELVFNNGDYAEDSGPTSGYKYKRFERGVGRGVALVQSSVSAAGPDRFAGCANFALLGAVNASSKSSKLEIAPDKVRDVSTNVRVGAEMLG